jgi:dTDP-glucose pyrophosphorylase
LYRHNNIPKINPGITESSQKEITHIIETVIEQNFQFEQKYYKETDGLPTGAHTSAILAEAYIQHMEHKQIYQI